MGLSYMNNVYFLKEESWDGGEEERIRTLREHREVWEGFIEEVTLKLSS